MDEPTGRLRGEPTGRAHGRANGLGQWAGIRPTT